MKIEYDEGATPISSDETRGLIPNISTQAELNEWESENILEAVNWLSNKKFDILTEKRLLELHKKMFGNVWKWAGQFRDSNKNIGVDKSSIAEELRKLIDDTNYHIKHNTYGFDEIAVRFHHRLVWIHVFPNGNGRHARFATDYLLTSNDKKNFTWGSKNLATKNNIRKQYIQALKHSDQGNYKTLLNFVRT